MQRTARTVRELLARATAALRRVDRLPVATVAAVAALAVLTTFTAPASVGSDPVAAEAGERVTEAAPVEPRRWAPRPAPEVPAALDLLATDLTGLSDEEPSVPEVGGDLELSPFERTPGGELSEDEVIPADLVVRVADGDSVDTDALAGPLAGARHTAPAATLRASTPGEDGDREVTVLGVDGATFRPLTPEITAAADAVWDRFADGDVLITHELAEELGTELGGELVLTTDAGDLPVRVGAFAVNGVPAFADVLVPVTVAEQLGVDAPNTLIVAAGSGDPADLGDALATATGGEVELRREPAPPVAEERTTQSTPSGRIEPFTYTSRADGRIDIHGDWIARNIVRVQLPGMASTSCHRVMVPQLIAAVEELIERDLYGHLDPSQFAGCFVARHIDWNPDKPLSMHAWGLAIDFNTRDNWLGATPKMDRRVVEVFERWGFEWGGWWSRPDGMHFELARIVPTS